MSSSQGSGYFGCNPNNGGSGPGKPNGDDSDKDDVGIPKYPKTDSESETIDQPEVNESFKSNSSLKKVTKRALGNQDVKREYTRILKRIGEGVDPMDIGRSSTDLGDSLTYVRGRHGRYIIKDDNGIKDVVGIAYRGSRNDMKTLAKEMNKLYNVNIEPGGY